MSTPLPFNAKWYLSQNPDVATAIEGGAPFSAIEHFLLYGRLEGRSASTLFDTEHYLANNPDVAEAAANGQISAWEHFEQFGGGEGRSPTPLFNADFYLQQNPDVAAAIEQGLFASAAQHFALYGHTESRAINPAIDLSRYLNVNPDLAEAAANGLINAFDHLLQYGVAEGRDLGNGIGLSSFVNDPVFVQALNNGNAAAALGRVESVAPFMPTFERPAGWTPLANTPIPTDFVAPPGLSLRLVVPEGVVVPPGTVLPPAFDPPTPTPTPTPAPTPAPGGDSSGDDGPVTPVFSLTETSSDSKAWMLSTGNGNVVITEDGSNYVFTPASGSAVIKTKAEVTGLVVDNTISLSGTAAVLKNLTTITGAATVSDTGEVTATDLNTITAAATDLVTATAATTVTAAVTTSLTSALADLTTALVTNKGTSGDKLNTSDTVNIKITGVTNTSEDLAGLDAIHNSTSGSVTIEGTATGDTLNFGGFANGALIINGVDGIDLITGGQGGDEINGDEGNDLLFGGPGKDTLSGGNGADNFVFSGWDTPAAGITDTDLYAVIDTITDFATDDTIARGSGAVTGGEFGSGAKLPAVTHNYSALGFSSGGASTQDAVKIDSNGVASFYQAVKSTAGTFSFATKAPASLNDALVLIDKVITGSGKGVVFNYDGKVFAFFEGNSGTGASFNATATGGNDIVVELTGGITANDAAAFIFNLPPP